MPNRTRADLVQKIRNLIDDPSDQRWSQSNKIDELNVAQEQFLKDTKCLIDTQTTSSVADTASYDLPADILIDKRCAYNGQRLTRGSKYDFDLYSFGDKWSDDEGTPTHYYIDLDPDVKKLYLYPIPQTAVASGIVLEYVKTPDSLTSDSSVPFNSHGLLYPYHDALPYWAAKNLLMADPSNANIAKITIFEKEYRRYVMDCIQDFIDMERSRPLRIKGGRYYKNA